MDSRIEEMAAVELLMKCHELQLKAKELQYLAAPLETVRGGAVRHKKIKLMEAKAAAYSKASEFLFMLSQTGEGDTISMKIDKA